MSLIRFGQFAADPRTEELRRDGRRVKLPPQSFRVLLTLTRTPGELVTREALQAELWPATSEVEYEQGLNAAINRLREALGDSAAEPRYIETLPRRGYRFIGALTPDTAASAPRGESPPPDVPPPPGEPHPSDQSVAAETPPTFAPPAQLTTGSRRARRRRRSRLVILVLSALAAVALAAFLLRRGLAPAPPPGRLVPYTALGGEERAPSFAPDGTRIVFAWNGNAAHAGRFDLYVKAADSERLLRVTNAPARWLYPAWSPDAKTIAFTRRVDVRNDGARGNGLFIVPAMGGAERRIAGATFANPQFMQLSWSPDSRRIAYATFNESGSHVIRLVDVETMLIHPLAHAPDCWNAGMPAFSADGRQLAFVCTTSVGVYGVHVARLDGGRPTRLATVMGEPQGLAWDGDGSLIVANDSGDGGGLWKLTADGQMSRLPFGEEGSAPTRHGNDIAYVRAHQAVDIWRMDLAAREPAKTAQRLIFSTRSEITPQYSPDGARIVFQSNRSGSAEIWMADADGTNPVRLTTFNGPLVGAPQWCADGKRVAFDARAAGTSSIYVLDVDERQPRRLASANSQNSLPTWSGDCRSILASDGRRSLYKLPVDGGPAELFTKQQSYYAQMHGGDVIYNVKQPQGVALWSKPLAGGLESALPGMPLLDYADAWAVAPDGIYFTSVTAGSIGAEGAAAADGAATLQFYEFATARTRRVAPLPKSPTPGGGLGLAVSRDGRWLLYTQAGEAQSDIMLMDNP
jgi:Tol biopolymer transport system component/DNA-binding winged helix-turn-helix (wHTH) protein